MFLGSLLIRSNLRENMLTFSGEIIQMGFRKVDVRDSQGHEFCEK